MTSANRESKILFHNSIIKYIVIINLSYLIGCKYLGRRLQYFLCKVSFLFIDNALELFSQSCSLGATVGILNVANIIYSRNADFTNEIPFE